MHGCNLLGNPNRTRREKGVSSSLRPLPGSFMLISETPRLPLATHCESAKHEPSRVFLIISKLEVNAATPEFRLGASSCRSAT